MAVLVAGFAPAGGAQERLPEYQLAAGDMIRITVFQNPDLTIETRVTENGTISYPLVGSVKVGGLTIPSAEQAIAGALKRGQFMQSPQVNIALLQNRGNQVSVLGQVLRAGRFPLDTFNMRLSEVIAMAGGIAPTGADLVVITGVRNGKPFRRQIDLAAIFLQSELGEDMVVAGGDVIYVHRQPLFYVYGEVQKPGSYRVERAMTVQQALAQGGGPTLRGTERGLRLYRRNSKGVVQELKPETHDAVQADDVLYIRESLF
jgi:polysaccharide export outer membrane protein